MTTLLLVAAFSVVPQGGDLDRQALASDLSALRSEIASADCCYSFESDGDPDITQRLQALGRDRMTILTVHDRGTRDPNTVYMYRNERQVYWSDRRVWTRRSARLGREVDEVVRNSLIPLVTGWWPRGSYYACPEVNGVCSDILSAVSDSRYTIRHAVVGDVAAISMTGPRDEIVVDPARGYCLVERTIRRKDGSKSERVRVTGTRKAGSLWWPERFRVTFFDGDGSVTTIVRGVLRDLRVNSLTESDVVCRPAAGTLRLNEKTQRLTQIIPGGTDMLEMCRRALRRSVSRKDRAARTRVWNWALGGAVLWLVGKSFVFLFVKGGRDGK